MLNRPRTLPAEPFSGKIDGDPMIQIIRLLLTLPALIAAWFVANDALSLGLIETIVAVALIIGFAVVATGWTIRRDV
jgi:hypothetical protein